MPAAAVIPAPLVYIKVVAFKTLGVGFSDILTSIQIIPSVEFWHDSLVYIIIGWSTACSRG